MEAWHDMRAITNLGHHEVEGFFLRRTLYHLRQLPNAHDLSTGYLEHLGLAMDGNGIAQ